jgi:hypothetical protein
MTKKIDKLRRVLGPILENPEKYRDSMVKRGLSKDGLEVTTVILGYQVLEAAEDVMASANRLKNDFSRLMKVPEFRKFHAEQLKELKKKKSKK